MTATFFLAVLAAVSVWLIVTGIVEHCQRRRQDRRLRRLMETDWRKPVKK